MALNSRRPVALVTGASNGIGYELAAELARRGFDLVATGRSENIHTAQADLTHLGTPSRRCRPT